MRSRLRLDRAVVVSALVAGGCSSPAWHPVSVSLLPAAPPPSPHLPAAKADHRAPPPPPTPPPSPISGDLPADLNATLVASDTCATKTCAVPKSTAPADSPVQIWEETFAKAGTKLSVPKDGRLDVYGVVVSGEAKIRGVEEGAGKKAGAWTAFCVSGGGVDVEATNDGTRVVVALVGDGSIAQISAKKASLWKARAKPIEIKPLGDAADLAWAGGAFHARIAFEGDRRASLGILLAAPSAPVAPHQHDQSWEALAMLRADGGFAKAPAPGTDALSPPEKETDGAIALVPPATRHAWIPGGTKPLVGIQMYVPPGPEQRFKQLAGK